MLNDYLENLHVKFLAENPALQLSYTRFTRMRPKEIILVSYSSRKPRLCEKHQNFSLKLMPLKRMNLINTSNPDVFRKQFSDDDKLQDVLDKINDDEIRLSQWKRVSVEKSGKLIKKIKLVDVVQSSIEYTQGFTGKSIRMLCYFQDFQAESSPVLSEADVEEGLTCHVGGHQGCICCDVQYFCCVREEQLRLYLILQA